VSLDDLSFSGLARTLKLLPHKHTEINARPSTSTFQRPAHGLVPQWWRL